MKTLPAKPLIATLLSAATMILSGCATLFNSTEQKVDVNSVPRGAQVYLNGELKGVAPLSLSLNPANSLTVEFRKDGYGNKKVELESSADPLWIVLDCLFWPNLIVDASTKKWLAFDKEHVVGVLEKIQPPDFQNQHVERDATKAASSQANNPTAPLVQTTDSKGEKNPQKKIEFNPSDSLSYKTVTFQHVDKIKNGTPIGSRKMYIEYYDENLQKVVRIDTALDKNGVVQVKIPSTQKSGSAAFRFSLTKDKFTEGRALRILPLDISKDGGQESAKIVFDDEKGTNEDVPLQFLMSFPWNGRGDILQLVVGATFVY